MITTWTNMDNAERCAAIRSVYAQTEGSARSIAAALSERFGSNISRNTVIGFYGRHRDMLADMPLSGKHPGSGAAGTSAKRSEPIARAARVKKVDPVKEATVVKMFDRAQAQPAPKPLNVPLLELNHDNCRWPVEGSGAKTLFCGHNVETGKSYCACHARLSVGRGTEGERRALNIGKAA